MVALREQQKESSTPMSEEAILSKVFGEGRGHYAGRGRKVTSVGSSSSSSVQSQGPQIFTQKQLQKMFNDQQKQIESQNKFMTSLRSVLKKAKIPVPKFNPYKPVIEKAIDDDEEGEDEDEDEDEVEDLDDDDE